jgi:hypothetical protein
VYVDSLAEEVASRETTNLCYVLDNYSVYNVDDNAKVRGMFGGDFNFRTPDPPMLNAVEGHIADVRRAIQTKFATTRGHPE